MNFAREAVDMSRALHVEVKTMLLAYLWLRSSCHMAVRGGDGLRRLASQQRKLSMSKVRTPWRHRVKHATLRKTPAEKAQAAAKRREHQVTYHDALLKARGVVMEQATQLRELFGGHTVEWYFEEIMQQACMSKSKQETSRWNAFLREEVKQFNDGVYISLPPVHI